MLGMCLPQEHEQRWFEFWASKTRDLASNGVWAEVDHYVALIFRAGALLATFTPADIPVDIENQVAALLAPNCTSRRAS